MWTKKSILYEPFWKRSRFRFDSNINEPLREAPLPLKESECEHFRFV